MEMSTIMYGDICAQDQLLVEKLIADLAFFGALRKQDLRRLTFGSFSEILDGNIMVRLQPKLSHQFLNCTITNYNP